MPKVIGSGPVKETKSKENELYPLVNELREVALQYSAMGPFKANLTATTTTATIWTSDTMPEGALWVINFRAQAIGTAGRCGFVREGLFYRLSGGVVTQDGTTSSPVTMRTDPNMSVAFVIVGNTVTATVSDTSARTLSWYGWIQLRVSS